VTRNGSTLSCLLLRFREVITPIFKRKKIMVAGNKKVVRNTTPMIIHLAEGLTINEKTVFILNSITNPKVGISNGWKINERALASLFSIKSLEYIKLTLF